MSIKGILSIFKGDLYYDDFIYRNRYVMKLKNGQWCVDEGYAGFVTLEEFIFKFVYWKNRLADGLLKYPIKSVAYEKEFMNEVKRIVKMKKEMDYKKRKFVESL